MNDAKKAAIQTIDDHAALFCDVSRKIWEYAELSLKEFQSAALYEKVLAENGFAVTSNMGGIKTAFCGSWGHGHPVIGILGEFDALSAPVSAGRLHASRPADSGRQRPWLRA